MSGAAVVTVSHAKPHAQVSPETQARGHFGQTRRASGRPPWSDSQDPRSVVTLLIVIAG